MHKGIIPLGLFVLVLFVSLACSSITNIVDRASDAKETVELVVTEVVELATDEAPLIGTAQAYASEVPELKETIEAYASEVPDLKETAQVYASEVPDLKETVEAVITENPGPIETAKAIATEGIDMGEAPEDIPVVDETTISNFFGSEGLVTYTTSQDFDTVLEFYKTEMPANGWEADLSVNIELENSATLTWLQADRKAIVIISTTPFVDSTIVAINIQSR